MTLASNIEKWAARSHWRVPVLLFILMILPLAAFTFYITQVTKSQVVAQEGIESTQIARVAATLVEEHFRHSTVFLESIASRRTLRQAWEDRDMKLVLWHMERARRLVPDLSFISVYSMDGTMRAIDPPQPELVGKNYGFRDWYKGVSRSWKPYVSEVYRTAVAPRDLVVAVAVPICDDEGHPMGILMSADSLQTLSQRVVETELEGGWNIELLDQNSHLAARKHIGSSAEIIDLSDYEPAKRMQAGQAGYGSFVHDGQSWLTRYEPVPNYRWGVLVQQPSTYLQRRVWNVQKRILLLSLVFVMGGLLVSGLLSSLYARLEARNRFMELSVDMFCIAGFDGFFKHVNPSWEKALGFTAQELTTRPYMEFIHPDDRPATENERDHLAKGERTLALENRYLCKDGSYKWFSWNVVAVPAQGLMYAVARDVTQVKAWSQQIAQQNRELELRNREVERATKMKSRFLASMSHELRTPLNAIVGFSELLSEQSAGSLSDKQNRFVNHIRNGAAHLLQLINDILDLSKIESGQLDIHREKFSVREAMPEVLSTVQPLAMAKNLKIEHRQDKEYCVLADRVRFKQILYNLLSNAVKFTPKDGRIDITCAETDDSISISVTDTGIGIRPEDQGMVFEEFRQVEGNSHEGTGLGLAITSRLLERQGGHISLQSEVGKGSCFTFTLPKAERQAPVIAGPKWPVEARLVLRDELTKPLILVVDDELSARDLLTSYLDPEYRVITAKSGAEAIEKARKFQPAVITLDVLMKATDGFETLVTLRKIPETADIPVVILSIVDHKQVGFALGATDYLVKPIRKLPLLNTIRKHIPPRTDDDAALLLVDDDRKTLELMEETLRSAGYETQSVQNGARALEVLSSKLVSAVLLDLMMPGMDGFEVLRNIRQQETLKELPIFVITAKTLTRDEISLLSRQAQAWFQKDGTWQNNLLAEVGRVLGNKHAKGAAQG